MSQETKIGIVYICTGGYRFFLKPFLQTFTQKFCLETKKVFFIFTDDPISEEVSMFESGLNKIIYIPHKRLGWPYDTLYRFKIILEHADTLTSNEHNITHLFYTNANLCCYNIVETLEILPSAKGIVATEHPCFFRTPELGTFERDPRSTACISLSSQKQPTIYYQAAFFGGDVDSFLEMSNVLDKCINTDEKNGLCAVWHDESHLNRYLFDNPPVKVLHPIYLHPELFAIRGNTLPPKIIQLEKDKWIKGGKAELRKK